MMDSYFSKESLQAIQQLRAAGHEAYIVGGAVRDYLLQRKVRDVDLATSATPLQMKEIFSHTIDLGLAHGTLIIVLDGVHIEATSYRSGLELEKEGGSSLEKDLSLRDFTMNAMALSARGEVLDFVQGKKDLENGLIRAVGDAHDRFSEDPLRMLRAIRFVAQFNFDIEKETLQQIHQNRQAIKLVSMERIKSECDKIFIGPFIKPAFKHLYGSGLSRFLPLFPENSSLLDKLLPFTSAIEGWAFLTLAGNHSASEIVRAYKLSNQEKSFIRQVKEAYTCRLAKPFAIDEFYRFDVQVLHFVQRYVLAHQGEESKTSLQYFIDAKNQLPICSKEELAVTGKDLMAWGKGPSGKWIGKWMAKIEYAVLHGQVANHFETIKGWFLDEFNS